MPYELGVIGGGNMAEAIIKAAVDQQVLEPASIIVSDPTEQRRAIFEALGVATTDDNASLVAESQQVMLAVKPQVFDKIRPDLTAVDTDRQVLISIMAGISSHRIAEATAGLARVVRVMPNTPLLAGAGMSGIARGEHAREGDELLALQIFRAAGEAVELSEQDLDAVTGVSGSGPAYVFYLAEAMAEAAQSLNLPADVASLLTQQTILGAARLMRESDESPAELRRKVMSPGGTTEAAIKYLDAHNVRDHLAQAVRESANRSRELAG